MPTDKKRVSKHEKPQRTHRNFKKRPSPSEPSDSASYYSQSSERSNSEQAVYEFAQVYTKDDYQKLLRDYKALYQAHEEARKAQDELHDLVMQIYQLQQQYVIYHETDIQTYLGAQQNLEKQISELVSDKLAELMHDLHAQYNANYELNQTNSALSDQLQQLKSSYMLKITDLTSQFNYKEKSLKQVELELQQYRQIIQAYRVLTGVQITLTSKFYPAPQINYFYKCTFSLGDPLSKKTFYGHLGFDATTAAIECIHPPECASKQLFQEGVKCYTSEMWNIFGQMCAAIAQESIGE